MMQWVKTAIHKDPRLFGAARRTLFAVRRFFPAVAVDEFPGRIHPNDFMANKTLPGHHESYKDYIEHSRSHFGMVSACLQRAGRPWSTLQSAIDFGCGYGRVTRWLPTVISPTSVTACDVQKEAVAWCASEFRVRPLVAKPDIMQTRFESYDLFFAISVLTHLSPKRIEDLFETLTKIINFEGIVIFSTHGLASAKNARVIKEYIDPRYVLNNLEETGCAFIPYPHYSDKEIGDTFLTEQYVVNTISAVAPNFQLVSYDQSKFWAAQDCYVFRKSKD
jgi:SAM-dependent methyltransferase